jgi:hypothetical protein
MSLNDFDMPTVYRLQDEVTVAERILKVSVFPLFLVFFLTFLLPYTLQDAIIEALAITGFNFGVLSLYLLLSLEVYIPIVFVVCALLILGLSYYCVRYRAYRVEPGEKLDPLNIASIKAMDEGAEGCIGNVDDDYMNDETDKPLEPRISLKPATGLNNKPHISDSIIPPLDNNDEVEDIDPYQSRSPSPQSSIKKEVVRRSGKLDPQQSSMKKEEDVQQ